MSTTLNYRPGFTIYRLDKLNFMEYSTLKKKPRCYRN